MKTTLVEQVKCPNCMKTLATLHEGMTAGKVRKCLADAIGAHLPHCKKRGDGLDYFAKMFGSAGKWATMATLFKLLHDDEIARKI